MRFRQLMLVLVAAGVAGLVLGAMLALVAPVDQEQSRICRAILPALAPDGADITVTRIGRGPAQNSVRVDYRVVEGARAPRLRMTICAFAGGGLATDRTDLVAVATERGRMSDASLFFLKRYWLDQPSSSLETPAGPAMAPLLGTISPRAGYAIQQAAAGLPLVAVTGLMATAYALVYGLVGRVILSFGEFAALGAAGVTLGVSLAQASGVMAVLPLLAIGLLFAGWVTASWGGAAARFVLAPIVRRPGQHVLIATAGLALFISEGIRLTQGHNARWLSPIWNKPITLAETSAFAVTTTPMTLVVAVVAFAAAAALVMAMRRSAYGRAWRACADDALAASLCGIDPGRTVFIACALACGVAGLAGFLLTLHIGGMGFAGGAVFGLKALVGAITGGVGSVGGALLGGLAVGTLETIWSATMPIEWRDVAVFVLLSVVLILRPGGLFGDGGQSDKPQGRAL